MGVRDGGEFTCDPYPLVIDTDQLHSIALVSGAAGLGVTPADPFPEAAAKLTEAKAAGLSGPLHFTYDSPETATDVRVSFPWARSIVAFSHAYLPGAAQPSSSGAVVARFATSDHYGPLREVADSLTAALVGAGHRAEALIDDNRLVDRAAATRAGLGWHGKSTMVLAPGYGPWLLLGSVVTDATLQPTPPMKRDCGTCVACIPACPTGAITEAGLDARRCISTWLQTPGTMPRWIRPHVGRRIYGCDDCLTSCPPGARAMDTSPPDTLQLSLEELLALADTALLDRFPWWYVPRRDGRFIRRNLLIAAGNSRESGAVPLIIQHLTHPSSMIRGHAAWALARSLGNEARAMLEDALESETVKEPTEELEYALKMIAETRE